MDDAVQTLRDRLFERAFDPTLSLDDVSDNIWFNYRYVRQRFTITYGVTPWRYVERVRIERACQLLRDDVDVMEIGTMVGYRSDLTFAAAFRRRLGVSPRAYRRLVRAGASEETLAVRN